MVGRYNENSNEWHKAEPKVLLTKNFSRAPFVAYNYRQKADHLQLTHFTADIEGTRFRVRISGSLFQSNICNSFLHWDLAVVRIIGVFVIAVCPQGESWL